MRSPISWENLLTKGNLIPILYKMGSLDLHWFIYRTKIYLYMYSIIFIHIIFPSKITFLWLGSMMAVVAILQKPCKNHALASRKTRLSQGTLFQLDGFGDDEAARIRGGGTRGWHGSLTWPSIFRRWGARLGRGNVKRGRLAIATIPSKTSVLEVYFSHGTDLHQCFIRSLCTVWFAQWNNLSAQWSGFFYLYHTGQEANQLTLHSKLSPSQLLSMHPNKSKTWSVKLMDYVRFRRWDSIEILETSWISWISWYTILFEDLKIQRGWAHILHCNTSRLWLLHWKKTDFFKASPPPNVDKSSLEMAALNDSQPFPCLCRRLQNRAQLAI